MLLLAILHQPTGVSLHLLNDLPQSHSGRNAVRIITGLHDGLAPRPLYPLFSRMLSDQGMSITPVAYSHAQKSRTIHAPMSQRRRLENPSSPVRNQPQIKRAFALAAYFAQRDHSFRSRHRDRWKAVAWILAYVASVGHDGRGMAVTTR